MKAHAQFLDSFAKEVACRKFGGVAVTSFLGSCRNDELTKFSDLDLLVILNNPPKCDPTNSRNYIELVRILKAVQERFDAKREFFCVFPTFRIEEFMRAFAYMSYKDRYALVHLLVYPSWKAFADWEMPSLVESACATGEIIFGRREVLKKAKSHIKKLSIERNMRPLLFYLYETYRFLECSQIPEKIKCLEVFHMLEYVTHYLCGEILRSKGYSIAEAYS
jgi:predicted nucleotidyltransferase